MLLFLGSSQISGGGGGSVGSGVGSGGVFRSPGAAASWMSPWDRLSQRCSRESRGLGGRVCRRPNVPSEPRGPSLRRGMTEKDPASSSRLFPKVTRGGRRRDAGDTRPPMPPAGPCRKFSKVQHRGTLRLPVPPPPPRGLSTERHSWGRGGRRGAHRAAASVRPAVCPSVRQSGVTGPAGPSECGLEVGVQDGLSIWGLDVVGSLLQLQQHGHQRVRL